jgi:hypothetical protein
MTIYEQDSTIYQGDLFNQKDSKYWWVVYLFYWMSFFFQKFIFSINVNNDDRIETIKATVHWVIVMKRKTLDMMKQNIYI